MFKLTEDKGLVRTLGQPVEVPGYETVPANATIPQSHRLWATYQAWLAAGNTPEPFDTRTLEEIKADQIRKINAASEADVAALTAGVPEYEVKSWDRQEREARAILAASTKSTPLLDALGVGRGISRDALAEKVVLKADSYTATIGDVIGRRQALEDKINAATTRADVEAINWA